MDAGAAAADTATGRPAPSPPPRPLLLRLLLVALLLSGAAARAAPQEEQQLVFRSVPTTVKTSENDTVLLPCYVHNLGESTVRWWWSGRLVADSGNPSLESPPRMRMWPNHTLQVERLTADDTGEYTCEVVRPHPWGPVRQQHAIEVLYPPSVTPIPEDGALEVRLGDNVRMECQAEGVPQPIVTWTYNGLPLELIDHRSRLQFKAVSQELSGVYQCTASNGVGDPASADIHLTILYPPNVSAEQPWVHAAPGVRAELACLVSADPEARVMWLKDGKQITSYGRYHSSVQGPRYSLIIRKVEADDLGFYKCRASNQLGSKEDTVQLSGVAKPAVFKKDRNIGIANNYTLIWEVDSYSPIIEYHLLFRRYEPKSKEQQWTKLVIPADRGGPLHSKSYTLTGLQLGTVYEAMLLSRNQFGWSSPSELLRFGTEGASDSYEEEDSLAEPDDSEEPTLHVAVPSLIPEYSENNSGQLTEAAVLMVLYGYSFIWLL
ncbi:limbic system-associated membrane protein-like [Schistocerca serialis cubense]|uniref:limbic system-associated membrane protein-like n=1 Tax=Schistocerca serialis cubense TaxID=2023355 RepID=UPI00214F4013|nr:limbic system-associated membrane protein-like [Schistocerca serialis cubense]